MLRVDGELGAVNGGRRDGTVRPELDPTSTGEGCTVMPAIWQYGSDEDLARDPGRVLRGDAAALAPTERAVVLPAAQR